MVKGHKTCRICDGRLKTVLDLGSIYPSTFVGNPGKSTPYKAPLCLSVCDKCGLVQLRDTVNLDDMYREYWYESGLNASMVADLKNVVEDIESFLTLRTGDIVVDIGCNDGTMLDMYRKKDDIITVGYDPAFNLACKAEGRMDHFFNDYFIASYYNEIFGQKAKVVTSIAMFYDLEDPNAFVEDVKKILHPDGVWVIQFTDLLSMLKQNAFDNICHEHLEYYSFEVLMNLMNRHGLEVVDVSYNKVNGGSIRVFVGFPGMFEPTLSVGASLLRERSYMDMFENPFKAFAGRVDRIANATLNYLYSAKLDHCTVYGMGASTKGNTFLQYIEADVSMVSKIAEVHPDKVGLKTVGTYIPIISDTQALEEMPDMFLVLPWHFIDFFLSKYQDYLEKGGRMVVAMPEPRVYSWENGKLRCQQIV
jgi:hypothetical protein